MLYSKETPIEAPKVALLVTTCGFFLQKMLRVVFYCIVLVFLEDVNNAAQAHSSSASRGTNTVYRRIFSFDLQRPPQISQRLLGQHRMCRWLVSLSRWSASFKGQREVLTRTVHDSVWQFLRE